MIMGAGVEKIHEKIQSFKRKYYLNLFVKGAILTLSIIVSYYVIAAIIEHNLWLGPWARFCIFMTFILVVSWCIYAFLKEPLSWWISKKGLSQEQSARIIGNKIPSVSDRLLNLLQLSASKNESSLTYASIQQKSAEFEPVAFDRIIDLRDNKKYLRFLVLPVIVILSILAFNRSIITQSTDRLVHFNRHYSPQAPFRFVIDPKSLTAYYNEDFTLNISMVGEAIPEDVYLITDNQRLKLSQTGSGAFSYSFENVQQAFDFQFEAAGFYSENFHLALVSRPELLLFNVELEYPRYVQRQNQKLVNAGNLEIPEGTVVHWNLSAVNTENATIRFSSQEGVSNNFKTSDHQLFTFAKDFRAPDQYEISLNNDQSSNKEKIAYHIEVTKDQYPQITINNFKDSVLYKRIILGGVVGDDYGVSQLSLHFRILDQNQKEVLSRSVNIPLGRNQQQQSFFYNWSVDSLKLNPGDQLDYYLQVWDNDGINGRKSTKTARYAFQIPTEENLIAEITKSQSQTEQKIDQSSTKANKLQDQIEQAHQKLKGKQSLDWQDKKMLEDIVQQKQSLDQMIEKLKEENKLLEEKKETFTEQDERIKEKAKQIQKLMEDLLDEETKKLFAELQKLLQENAEINQIQKLLDKLNQNTNNLEKELERTLELFKELQYEYKLDQAVQSIKEQVEDQKKLLEKTEQLEKENKNGKSEKSNSGKDENKGGDQEKSENEKLADEQAELKEKMKEASEKIEDLKKLGEELQKDADLPEKEDAEDVQEDQQDSQEDLQQNNPSKSKSSQQKALQKMQQMKGKMEASQDGMMMEMDMQNIESLRQIIHGLVKLSYDEENMLKQFNDLSQNDPRFNTIAQQQLKLRDDAKVLEDSLLALGKRDPFLGSIVTREVGDLNNHIDKVIEANRERRRPQASNEMQLSMTAINNLALMLDDHFDMMMQMMANGKPSMKKSKQKGQKPSLGQLQQQLNNKIKELKNSGKGGRELSEELAEMAAEQERIRKALQEMQDKMKDGKMPGGDLPGKMEQTEMDLVNKQITDQMIRRQQEILTRLLETEKSMREQDMDEERKGETAKDYDKEIPKAFEEYLRLKEKEVELLKTVPPKLYPYYKKEVGEYFKRMGNQ
jgi:hypothetical protein